MGHTGAYPGCAPTGRAWDPALCWGVLAGLFLLVACPAERPIDTADTGKRDVGELDAATVALRGECDMAYDFGGFEVVAVTGTTEVAGAVANGVVPERVLEVTASEGDCRVLRRNNPYCEPACEPGYACDFEGACIEYPANQDLGTVTVGGLLQAVTMTATFPGNTYFDTTLPHPAFEAGEVVYLDMPGGSYGPATFFGVGVEPLDEAPEWSIDPDADLVVAWTAPVSAVVRSTVVAEVSIDQHGITPSVLRCEFADDGEGTVPRALLWSLVGAGVTGFPAGSLSRRTADALGAGEGCMDFVVSWTASATVSVLGHTPCVSTDDCPAGEVCNLELQTCG